MIDAATAAGSKGGTVINARSGIHEEQTLFMDIEPEKEIVLIISDKRVLTR